MSYRSALLLLLIFVCATLDATSRAFAAVGPTSLNVAQCKPCQLNIHEQLPPIQLTFNAQLDADNNKTVTALMATSPGTNGWQQTLDVHDMQPLRKSARFFLGTLDLDFDGYLDFFFATARGTANTYADYWRYDVTSRRFVYLGNFPYLQLDTTRNTLSSYERGGNAGLIYEKRDYAYIGDRLEVVRREVQETTAQPDVFRKLVFERIEGRLEITHQEDIKAPPPK